MIDGILIFFGVLSDTTYCELIDSVNGIINLYNDMDLMEEGPTVEVYCSINNY